MRKITKIVFVHKVAVMTVVASGGARAESGGENSFQFTTFWRFGRLDGTMSHWPPRRAKPFTAT